MKYLNKFTVEVENAERLNFLDLHIQNIDRKLDPHTLISLYIRIVIAAFHSYIHRFINVPALKETY